MKNQVLQEPSPDISTIEELAELADYSFMDTLNRDPGANEWDQGVRTLEN